MDKKLHTAVYRCRLCNQEFYVSAPVDAEAARRKTAKTILSNTAAWDPDWYRSSLGIQMVEPQIVHFCQKTEMGDDVEDGDIGVADFIGYRRYQHLS